MHETHYAPHAISICAYTLAVIRIVWTRAYGINMYFTDRLRRGEKFKNFGCVSAIPSKRFIDDKNMYYIKPKDIAAPEIPSALHRTYVTRRLARFKLYLRGYDAVIWSRRARTRHSYSSVICIRQNRFSYAFADYRLPIVCVFQRWFVY